MANYMKQVAEIFGVELEEEFLIETRGGAHYKFTNDGLMHNMNCGNAWDNAHLYVLEDILKGRHEVIKLPWKPKKGDTYFMFIESQFDIGESTWDDWGYEFLMLKHGMIFRTEKEAIEARPRIYKELTGKEWRGNNG